MPTAPKPRKGSKPSARVDAPAPPRSFSQILLTVGHYRSNGEPGAQVAYEGEKLAEHTSEGSGVFWGLGSRSSFRVERSLYLLGGQTRFAVHAILCSGSDHHPVLARVELYPSWSHVARAHPDLARSALSEHGEEIRSLSHSHQGDRPAVPSAILLTVR